MNNPKKILIFSHAYFPNWVGGAEIALKEITDRISHDACEFHLITLGSTEPAFEQMGNITVHRLCIFGSFGQRGIGHKLAKYLFIPVAFFKGTQLQRKHQFDVFWALMATYGGFSALFMKLAYPKKEFVLTLQEGDPIEYILGRLGIFKSLYRAIFSHADKVQVISSYLAQFARDMGFRGEPIVIPNGVDIKHFSQRVEKKVVEKNEGDIVLITASRLVKKNAVGDIVAALALLPVNYRFLIAGTGELATSLKLKVESLKLENRVTFLGHISHEQLPAYLQQSDIFIRPSLSEGLGNAFLEAMASGIPVIATPVGGIPDFLEDGETGIFCEPNNPQTIANAVEKFSDTTIRQKVTANAKKMVEEKYGWDLIAEKMKQLFLQ